MSAELAELLQPESHDRVAFVVTAAGGEWFVVSPDQVETGPYWSAAIALEVAFRQVLQARNRGMDAEVLVRDDCGDTHRCMLFDEVDSYDPCCDCERSWLPFPQPARCPLLANRSVH